MAYPLKEYTYSEFINALNNTFIKPDKLFHDSNDDKIIYVPNLTDVPNASWNINIYDPNVNFLLTSAVNVQPGSRVFYIEVPNVIEHEFQTYDYSFDNSVWTWWVRAAPAIEFQSLPNGTYLQWSAGTGNGILSGAYDGDYGRYYKINPGTLNGITVTGEYFTATVTSSLYRIIVYNDQNEITYDETFDPATYDLRTLQFKIDSAADVPSIPQVSNIGPISFDQIIINWDQVDPLTSKILIEKSLDGITWNNLVYLDPEIDQYIDTGLNADTGYRYRIRGINGVGSGSAGSHYYVVTQQLPVPEIPQDFVAVATSYQQVYLTWSDQSTPADILIERASSTSPGSLTPDTPYSQIISLPNDSTNYSNLGLTANTRYFYRIRAANVYGTSSYSSVSFVNTLNYPVTNPPKSFSATATSSSTINLTWSSVENHTGYLIEISTDNATWIQIADLSAATTSYNSTGLTGNTLYYYRMRSYNAFGNSSYSKTANATTLP
jgi:hypothetical protein